MPELLGTDEPTGPLQNKLHEGNRTVFRIGQTAILTNQSGVRRRYECQLLFGARPIHAADPGKIFEERMEGERAYSDGTVCGCRRIAGPASDAPISPTQRALGPSACTDLAAPTAVNCTRFSGPPTGLDRWLHPRMTSTRPLPFSSTACTEVYCVHHHHRG